MILTFLQKFGSIWLKRQSFKIVKCNGVRKHGGLMVSALDSGSSGPGLSAGWALCYVLGQDTLLCIIVHVHAQVSKWVTAINYLMLGGPCNGLACRGE